MTKRRAQLFSLVVLLSSVLSVAGFARFNSATQETVKPNIFAADPALKDLINYRQWMRVNEQPVLVVTNSFQLDAGG
jgi:hypothetical protein